MKTWEYKIINVRSENYSMIPVALKSSIALGDAAGAGQHHLDQLQNGRD
jgi:hypothetical protein